MVCVFRYFFAPLVLGLILSGQGAQVYANSPEADKERLVIVFASAREGEPVFRMAESLVAEIGRRMGITIKLISLPVNRAAYSVVSGQIDAELSRIRDYGAARPELIRVAEPIARIAYHAYALKPYDDLKGWQSLKPYRIVHRMGLQFVEEYLGGMNVHAVNSTASGLAFILRDRADLYIETPALVEPLLQTRSEYRDVVRIDPPIAWFDTFTYFAPQRPVMALRYLQALQSMKTDGTYQLLLKLPQQPERQSQTKQTPVEEQVPTDG